MKRHSISDGGGSSFKNSDLPAPFLLPTYFAGETCEKLDCPHIRLTSMANTRTVDSERLSMK